MTVAHLTPALRAPSLTSALGALRARGMRVSTARRQVLEALYSADGPVSAEALTERLPGSDLASVYRNLVVLEEVGLVRHVHLGHGPGRYAPATTTTEFVTCDRCGAHEAFDPHRIDAARELIERELGYRPRFTHFPIVGVCAACQEKEDGHAHS
ncbi:MAG TPA: Fur family transcriptional regulator [Solirubrobacter sp.]|nr:Fur family transcriptional regulator [Solirubrobacter sp.]